jgi:Trypsin-like peptidase domain
VLGFPFGRAVEVGRPVGQDAAPQPTLTRGSVAALRAGDGGEARYIQTDASVHPGSSGGPMVDEDGRAVGVIRMMLGRESGPAFGIPINRAKEFLERSSLERLFPARRLGLGPLQAFDWKGLRLRLPDGFDDGSRARLRVEGGEPEGVMLKVDRVASPLALADVEAALMAGKTFAGLVASERSRSRPVTLAAHPAVIGSARGRSPSSPDKGEVEMEYAIVDLGKEKVAVRYFGPADQVAFNRAVLRASVETLEADPLLTAEVAAPPPESFEMVAMPEPEAPPIALPRRWTREPVAPVACRGLAPPDAALSASPEGDFTVSLRAAWWRAAAVAPEDAATACGSARESAGPAAYSRRRTVLGVTVAAEGQWLARGAGLLRLEVEAPEAKLPLLRALFAAWVKTTAGRI